jgi:hypothetical protein
MCGKVSERVFKGFLTGSVVLCVALSASAQFGLPRIPKLPKVPGQKNDQPAQNPQGQTPTLPAPEVTAITPDSAPPGGAGDVTLTGKNFSAGMRVNIACNNGVNPAIDSFKVEDAGRAVLHMTVPLKAAEGPCEVSLRRKAGGGEIGESSSGTIEVFQVPSNGPRFAISILSKMPIGLPVIFLAEGDQDFINLMMSMQKAMQPGFGAQGEKTILVLGPDSIKCAKGQTTLFSGAVSDVKAVEEMNMMGESTGMFRIEFKDGKMYNLVGADTAGGSGTGKATVAFVKKRLGK